MREDGQLCFSSVQFSHSVASDSLRPYESQHARPPCPSPAPEVYPDSCPSSWWCHPAISSSVVPFSSCPQSLPASGSFPMSQLFAWGGQSIGFTVFFETSSVTDYWQKFFFFFPFSVLPVRAPKLTMQCAQIQINHHYAGLWAGHDFHPEFPSFATCSKVCTDASEME